MIPTKVILGKMMLTEGILFFVFLFLWAMADEVGLSKYMEKMAQKVFGSGVLLCVMAGIITILLLIWSL